MALFRKKSAVIEALEFRVDNWREVETFLGSAGRVHGNWQTPDDVGYVAIQTLEGQLTAQLGDYIIRGTAGEFYPCKPYIFAEIYEPAETPAAVDPQAGAPTG